MLDVFAFTRNETAVRVEVLTEGENVGINVGTNVGLIVGVNVYDGTNVGAARGKDDSRGRSVRNGNSWKVG